MCLPNWIPLDSDWILLASDLDDVCKSVLRQWHFLSFFFSELKLNTHFLLEEMASPRVAGGETTKGNHNSNSVPKASHVIFFL